MVHDLVPDRNTGPPDDLSSTSSFEYRIDFLRVAKDKYRR
jgi:hypothetical protein